MDVDCPPNIVPPPVFCEDGAPLVAVPLGCCELEVDCPDGKLNGDDAFCLFTSPNKLPPPPALVPAGADGVDALVVVLIALGKLNMLPVPEAPADEVVGACAVDVVAPPPPNTFEALLGGLPAGVVLNVSPEDRVG